jgi:signal transduction histidine kinase
VNALAVVSVVLAVAWGAAAFVDLAAGRRRRALIAALPGAAQAGALWAPLAPLVLAAWLGYAIALPDAIFASAPRRAIAGLAAAGAITWSAIDITAGRGPSHGVFFAVALGAAVIGVAFGIVRYRDGTTDARRVLQWIAAAAVGFSGFVVVCGALHIMTGAPKHPGPWLAAALVVIPLAHVMASAVPGARAAERALGESFAAAGVAALVAVAYLVLVVGIVGSPHGHERGVLLASLVAATAVAILAAGVRQRLISYANAVIGARSPSTEEVVTSFGARMSRALPMDELLLQLAESLRATVPGTTAEIWTGTDGNLNRTVSVPAAAPARLQLAERERVVIGQARIGGPAWAAVWLPDLHVPGGDMRVVPVAHLGDLLGLIAVRRAAGVGHFNDDDERALVDVARQLGLALHNVRLDSALQASLEELAERNVELQASRLRIVNSADASRREIERNLHDGAQQHLVALAVKLGIARQVAEDGDTRGLLDLLENLRGDVQTTITELRELAHGIYPPLLRDRGLGEALRAAAGRCAIGCSVDVDLPGRYPEAVETAAYFCCLEAMQNAAKYAGADATLTITVSGPSGELCAELIDDGPGFDPSLAPEGHGFTNMRDRLGALGGRLHVTSAPGAGTSIRASIPAAPLGGGRE